MNAPPIPSFEPYSCPNCGLPLRERVEFCPACGARIMEKGGLPYWVRVLTAAVLALFMLPVGLAGACFLFFAGAGVLSGGAGDFGIGGTAAMGGVGLVLAGLAVLCGIAVFKLLKR